MLVAIALVAGLFELSDEQRRAYEANGFVKIPGVLNTSETHQLYTWVEEVSALPPTAEGKWMHHFEDTPEGARLTRTEAFVSYHAQLGRLLMAGRVPSLVGSALGEPVFLYKEKINYKHSGGAGYNAHQDAPAYKQLSLHATALVSVDRSSRHNGCLEFAAGRHKEGLLGMTSGGILSPEVEEALEWTPCPTEPGDVVIFSSYVPHRSSPNYSGDRRALLYLTYNAQAEGYLRDEYYRHKRANMQAGALSLISHFQGKALQQPSEALAAGSCATSDGVERALDTLRTLFRVGGDTMYDRVVTQREHALQSARLAEAAGASDALVVAALLHDVGHLLLDEHMGNSDFLAEDKRHEELGAAYLLRNLSLPATVAEPIRLHVPAKRYLCHADPAYHDGLSDASKRSLEVQGGVLSAQEAAEFLAKPHARAAAEVRRWDDRAKVAGTITPGLEHYLAGAVARVLRSAA